MQKLKFAFAIGIFIEIQVIFWSLGFFGVLAFGVFQKKQYSKYRVQWVQKDRCNGTSGSTKAMRPMNALEFGAIKSNKTTRFDENNYEMNRIR